MAERKGCKVRTCMPGLTGRPYMRLVAHVKEGKIYEPFSSDSSVQRNQVEMFTAMEGKRIQPRDKA